MEQKPRMSKYFESIQPSPIRLAGLEFARRADASEVDVLDVSIGNVSLPMPAMFQERMFNLNAESSPFEDGVNAYTCTKGTKEANEAFLTIFKHSGFDITHLHTQVTEGASKAMELAILGVCGDPGEKGSPLLLMDAAYTNYMSLSKRLGRETISVSRNLDDSGCFTLPDMEDIEASIIEHKPNALVVIPCDNPTGQSFSKGQMVELAELCVKYNMWIISDEAYRELVYTGKEIVSIWGITEDEVPGILGRRISIESSSKMWNSCGLRIGALVTDNQGFIRKSISENTSNLCANSIGQYIFGALARAQKDELDVWYDQQRAHYSAIAKALHEGFQQYLPDVIVSKAEASIYSVIDLRNMVDSDFNCQDFITFCASKGKVEIDGKYRTLFLSPMLGFYTAKDVESNPGRTQMRISYVRDVEEMKQIPILLKALLEQYCI